MSGCFGLAVQSSSSVAFNMQSVCFSGEVTDNTCTHTRTHTHTHTQATYRLKRTQCLHITRSPIQNSSGAFKRRPLVVAYGTTSVSACPSISKGKKRRGIIHSLQLSSSSLPVRITGDYGIIKKKICRTVSEATSSLNSLMFKREREKPVAREEASVKVRSVA